MRILIVDNNLRDTATARLALDAAGHEVEHASPGDPRLHETMQGAFDVVVVEWLPQSATLELLHEAANLPAPPSVLVCTAKATPPVIAALFAAGADDYLKKPYFREELVGRIGRIASTRARDSAAACAVANLQARTGAATRLAAWKQFDTLAADCLAGMTLLDLSLVPEPSEWRVAFASSMPLSYTVEHLEFRVAVDGSQAALEAISNAAVGMATPEAICDLLNEMANIAGGAFMRGALDESVALTCGLPAADAPAVVDGLLGSSRDIMTCWLRDSASQASFRVRLAVRARGNMLVPATCLREGMVLAKDILAWAAFCS